MDGEVGIWQDSDLVHDYSEMGEKFVLDEVGAAPKTSPGKAPDQSQMFMFRVLGFMARFFSQNKLFLNKRFRKKRFSQFKGYPLPNNLRTLYLNRVHYNSSTN